MSYTTLAALVGRYGEPLLTQATDRDNSGQIDEAVVAQQIANAAAVIDASLAVRYRLPLVTVPAIVAELALAIAIYKLHVFSPDQKIKDEYDQALRDLRDLADGRKKLDVAGLEPATSGAGGVIATDRPRPLTPETMTGFI